MKSSINKKFFLITLMSFISYGCSSGTSANNGTQQSPQQWSNMYFVFSESNLTLSVNESESLTLFMYNPESPVPTTLNLYSSNPGIVNISPNVCEVNLNNNPPSCNFIVTGIESGYTQISTDGFAPQQPLSVTVIP